MSLFSNKLLEALLFLPTNSTEVYIQNISRLQMLILAMEKIKAYNEIYRGRPECTELGLDYVRDVARVQNEELVRIEEACALHVIIAIPVTFEAYCKELIQEVLSNKPSYFLGIGTSFSGKLNPFIDANDGYNHEVFSGCGIRYRKDFLAFFDEYKIPFLIPEEVAFLEKVYDLRNTIIHDSGNNQRIKLKIEELIRKTSNTYMLATLAKRFRTEFDRIIRRAEKRVRGELRGRT